MPITFHFVSIYYHSRCSKNKELHFFLPLPFPFLSLLLSVSPSLCHMYQLSLELCFHIVLCQELYSPLIITYTHQLFLVNFLLM